MNLEKAILEIEYDPGTVIYTRDFTPGAEAVIRMQGQYAGADGYVVFANGVQCADYIRDYCDGDTSDDDMVSEAIERMCEEWSETYGRPSKQPTDGAGLFGLFVTHGTAPAAIAGQDLNELAVQVAELRDYEPDVIPLTDIEIARRILAYARDA